jgi:hypothetical protein
MTPTPSARSKAKPRRRPPQKAVEPPLIAPAPEVSVRPTGRLPSLPEPPHTHLICRACARILEVPMEFDQQQTLEELVRRTPAGWTVDTITVSMTGACPRCREGPRV